MKYSLTILLIFFPLLAAPSAEESRYIIQRNVPLFNVQKKVLPIKQLPVLTQSVPAETNDYIIQNIDSSLPVYLETLTGETLFLDLFLTRFVDKGSVTISLEPNFTADTHISSDIYLAPLWLQAGTSTSKSKLYYVKTYELLLKTDININFNDKWKKDLVYGDWIYFPPAVATDHEISTNLDINARKRLLIKFTISNSALNEEFSYKLIIDDHKNNKKEIIDIIIRNHKIPLEDINPEKIKLCIFTGFTLDTQPGRLHSYLNSKRLPGNEINREKLIRHYLHDIKSHGFNGITVSDWRPKYLEKIYAIAKEEGLQHVIIHAVSPKNISSPQEYNYPINETVINLARTYGFQPIFYGHDEVGGNKLLHKQLELNKKIHAINGLSMNAAFWKDRESVLKSSSKTDANHFDILAYSMGSNGYKELFTYLPRFRKPNNSLQEMCYWHPHVETPTRNRLFIGLWLWASQLDGVIPHGYFFPSHAAAYAQQHGETKLEELSPYIDDSFWLPPGNLRHHATVYPTQDGTIPTLQWEALLQGVTDLRFVLTLQKLLSENIPSDKHRAESEKLLAEIRSQMLHYNSSALSVEETKKIAKILHQWRNKIRNLLIAIEANSTR